MSRIALVVAVARNGVIGQGGALPWHIPSDLKRFKTITLGKPVIMGRKTWESLKLRPLPGRLNIVITRQTGYRAEGAEVATGARDALRIANAEQPEEICVIGGGEIYGAFLPLASRIYLTEVDLEPAGDTVFPNLNPKEWQEVAREVHARSDRDDAGFVLRTLDRIGASPQT
jgi:dihydrofolate reductase